MKTIKVITKMTGLRLLEEIVNNNLPCGTMIRYKREDIALMTNPPQPVYEYYKYTAGDKRFHRCDENGKLGAKGQIRFMSYSSMKKEYEVLEIIEEDKKIEKWGNGALEEIKTKKDYKINDIQLYIEILMETQNKLIDVVN